MALENVNILSQELLPTPAELRTRIAVSDEGAATVERTREAIGRILARHDHRLLVVSGPCSIHDLDAAHEYAERLVELAAEVEDTFLLVMRVYFEKPR
ncbi:MAG: 3-deoxy-7-phosphoheptulonate synthase, partial [Myxococcales bacterium]|nr:3-deoxy-7-phosphoheptulonate synthase [Myxococcales bacterium]